MKIVIFYEDPPVQDLSEAWQGRELFSIFRYQSAAQEALSGAAALIATGSRDVPTLSLYWIIRFLWFLV